MKKRPDITDSADEKGGASSRSPGLLVQLGLMASDVTFDGEALDQRLSAFANLWPAIFVSLLLGLSPQAGPVSERDGGWIMIAVLTMIGLSPLLLFHLRAARKLAPNRRVLILSLVCALIGAACGSLALDASSSSVSPAGLLFIVAAGFVVMGALSRIPATMLSFATALIGVIVWQLQAPLALAILAPMLLCTTLVTVAAARRRLCASAVAVARRTGSQPAGTPARRAGE